MVERRLPNFPEVFGEKIDLGDMGHADALLDNEDESEEEEKKSFFDEEQGDAKDGE